MVNDMMDLLSDVPGTLAAGWAVWLGSGLLLAMWYRKAKEHFEVPQVLATRTVARATSAPRPVAEARPVAEPRPVSEPRAVSEPRPVAVARPKPAPISVGDPFGDLATLLDQPAESAPPPAPAYRVPSESPILNSAGSPVLRKNDPDPGY